MLMAANGSTFAVENINFTDGTAQARSSGGEEGAHPYTASEREPSSARSMPDGFEAIINNSRLFSVPWPLRAEDGSRSGQNGFGTGSRCTPLMAKARAGNRPDTPIYRRT